MVIEVDKEIALNTEQKRRNRTRKEIYEYEMKPLNFDPGSFL